jgi:long-chain acyl-CoA synthetase
MFRHRIGATPNRVAFQYPNPSDTGFDVLTWAEVGDEVRAITGGLHSLGVEVEQRCAIISSTRVEWILADLAIMCVGGATTTVYPTNTADECAFILSDSQSAVLFAEDPAQVEKILGVRDQLPQLKKIVSIAGEGGHDGFVISWEELKELGRKRNVEKPAEFDERIESIEPQHLATLIYTSGTTGRPKGVELIHDCWVYEGEAIDALGVVTADDHQYLWLPLSHSFGKMLEAAQLHIGFTTTVDGRIPKLVENLGIVRPTFMAAAPRIFEKVYNKIVTGAEAAGGPKWLILRWAIRVGNRASRLIQAGETPTGLLSVQYKIADALVFSKLRERFGGQLRFFISGAAPLSKDMAEFFHAAGIMIYEGYGLTESSAATFVNRPDAWRFGTVGKPMPGTELKIDPETKEILIRGRGVMRGYHNQPQSTAEALDSEGWLHTGDAGAVDPDGLLRITDRIKELIKTSGGKYVAPQKLEARLKALCPYLGHVVVHGDRRNFCTALVVLDPESIPVWAEDHGIENRDMASLATNAKVRAMVQTAVDQLNSELARYETIKAFAILPKDFSIEDGDLTPSMKVKRRAVEAKYAEVLDGFYSEAMASV